MTRTCTICNHPDHDKIDQALIDGQPYRRIAHDFAISGDAIRRHKENHVLATMAMATAAAEVVRYARETQPTGRIPVHRLASYRTADHLVLDEATSSLDDDAESAVIGLMTSLAPHVTVLMIAHRQSTIDAASYVVHFDDGRVLGTTTHAAPGPLRSAHDHADAAAADNTPADQDGTADDRYPKTSVVSAESPL